MEGNEIGYVQVKKSPAQKPTADDHEKIPFCEKRPLNTK